MKRIKEKIKAIWYVITDSEYAVFTVTVKNNVRTRSACLISDNSSSVFLKSIIKFTSEYSKKNKNY